jgi:hypothetical protein
VKALANNAYKQSIAAWREYGKRNLQGQPVVIRDPLVLRFVRAADLVKGFTPTDSQSAVKYALDALAATSGQNVNGSPTHWSIVFDTRHLRIAFRTSTHPDIRCISLHGLDFSRQTPMRMLDIHEQLSGDITSEMKDYSFRFHLEHAIHAGKKWGSDPSTIEKEIRYMESLLCEEKGAD